MRDAIELLDRGSAFAIDLQIRGISLRTKLFIDRFALRRYLVRSLFEEGLER